MTDSRFFKLSPPLSLQNVLLISGADVIDKAISDIADFKGIATLVDATSSDLSFLDNIKYKDQLQETKAGACFVRQEFADLVPDQCLALVTPNPYKAYALVADALYPDSRPQSQISDEAIISETAKIAQNVTIEPGAIIHDGVEISENCWIESGAIIKSNVILGEGCRIGNSAVVSHTIAGNNVRIYPGACVGQDGFGFAIDPSSGHVKVPQLGRVILEDGVQIGSNTTIDRGSLQDTVIGAGTWIDNLVQIGHNVKIGRGCIFVAQSGVSGSTVIDDFAVLAGQVGVAGHLHIGKGARIAAKSGVMRDVMPGEEQMGYPAGPIKEFMKQIAVLKRLTKKK